MLQLGYDSSLTFTLNAARCVCESSPALLGDIITLDFSAAKQLALQLPAACLQSHISLQVVVWIRHTHTRQVESILEVCVCVFPLFYFETVAGGDPEDELYQRWLKFHPRRHEDVMKALINITAPLRALISHADLAL